MQFLNGDNEETLPPGEVSHNAVMRMLDVTGTQPVKADVDKQIDIRKHAFTDIADTDDTTGQGTAVNGTRSSSSSKARSKWTHSEIRRLATADQWTYSRQQRGNLDVGTTCAIGNLLLKGMSATAVRKALGITPSVWNMWYDKGTDDGTDNADSTAQAPYNVFVFVVDHSQALMEMRAVQGWTGQFDRDWRSAQAFLVARNPDEWNPTSKSTIATTSKVDIEVSPHNDTASMLEVWAILDRAGALPTRPTTVEVLQVESVEVPNDHTPQVSGPDGGVVEEPHTG